VVFFIAISAACFKKPAVVYVEVDTNIKRIIQERDFDSLLVLYFESLGKARLLEIKLQECERK
jgi:hypothetical protein